MPQIGPLEILVILIVALVVFGPTKLPQLGRQVGRGYREFRRFQQGLRDDIHGAFDEDDDERPRYDGDESPRQIEPGKPDHQSAPPEPPPADTTS